MKVEYSITLTEFIKKMNLTNHTPDIDTDKILIYDPDINRPALQLAGFFEHFDTTRVQICGKAFQPVGFQLLRPLLSPVHI